MNRQTRTLNELSKRGLVAVVVLSLAVTWTFSASQTDSLALEPKGPVEPSDTEGSYDVPAGVLADWWAVAWPQLVDESSSLTGISPTADWSAEGNQEGAEFGFSVGTAGDVNGDGYDDVIVGAFLYDGGATDSGRAYVFHGSAGGLSTTPDRILDPPYVNTNGYFGIVVGTAGDVNGDGYDDVMVAMMNYDYFYTDEGAVYVWHGSASGLGATHAWMARGNATYAHLGWDLGSAGDVNGDGYDDVIAGAYRYDSATVSAAYVWYGSDTGLGVDGTPANADWAVTSDQTFSALGTHVGSAGDLNGDGYGDIWVGAPRYDNGETDEGMVFVWFGSETGLGASTTPSSADWTAESNQVDAQLSGRWNSAPQGGTAGTAGDVNGDGYDDFIAGANLYDNPETTEGAVFLWYGSASGPVDTGGTPSNADWMAEGNQADGWFSSGAGTAGDVNGDGYDDVVVGAAYFDHGGLVNQGLAVAWLGSADGLGEDGTPDNADWAAGSSQANAVFGWSVASAGDVNGDGFGDVIVGARVYDNGQTGEGGAFAYYGQVDPIEGLTATNDGPTLLGETTTLTATISSGSAVSYTWAFGDGQMGSGAVVTHTYSTADIYTAVVTATNATSEASASTVVTVQEAPAIGSVGSTTFVGGTAGLFTVTATGVPTPTIALSGTLPAGVTFTDNGDGTATLAGPPGLGTGGVYPLTIMASNGVAPDATQVFTLMVEEAPAITSGESATFVCGASGSFTMTATGVPTPTLGMTGALPAGVTFTDNGDGTATLAGTPGSGTGGAYPLTITASNGVAPDTTQMFTLTVEARVYLPLVVNSP